MRVALLLIFIAFPLLEIALLVRAGEVIGFWPTMGIVIATAVLGSTMLRRQGLQVLGKIMDELAAGRPPLEPLADAGMVIVSGAFLLTPGLITDTIGLLLLIPGVRTIIRRFLVQRILNSPNVVVDVVSTSTKSFEEDDSPFPYRQRRQAPGEGPVIEGEFERVNEKKRDPRR